MVRTALHNLAAHKLRLLTTGLAVMLGVAFMAGTLVLTDTIQKTFDDLFANAYGKTSAVVRAEAAFDEPNGFGSLRGRVDAALVAVVADVDGVAVAEGGIFGYAQLVDKQGDTVGNPQFGPPTVGGTWTESSELSPWTLVAGQAPQTDDEVVIDEKSANDSGYAVGDTAQVLVKGGPQTVRIAGIAAFGNASSPGGSSFILFTKPAAQRLVGEPGKFDDIAVLAEPGISQEELVERIAPVLPDGVEAVTGATVIQENQDAMRTGFSFFNTFMLIFAVIALLVGGFMIFNTFFITVAQRTRENALMRAIGASKRQILASVLVEALGVGVVASVVGLGVGVLVAAGLKTLLDTLGFDVPAGGVVFTTSTAVIALVAGVVVTLIAAISPARKAGKVPPIAAMQQVAAGQGGYGSKERIMVATALLAAGLGLLFYGLFRSPANALAIVGVGALLVFFSVAAFGRTIALPLSRVIGWPLPRLRGITGQMARENAMRNPKRTAATATPLMIGVGLVVFIGIFAASAKASFGKTVERSLVGDFVITSPAGFGAGGVDPTLAERLNTLAEVEAAAGVRVGYAAIDGSPQVVAAMNERGFDLVDVEPVAGSPADLTADAIGVFDDEAESQGLSIGDRVPVVFQATGQRDLRVAMIFANNQLTTTGDYLLGQDAYEANFADQFDYQVFVQKADGISDDAALAAVEQEAARFPGTEVLDRNQYTADQMQPLDQLLALVYALLGLAILIALLGIANTLALSILERVPELGLLRAVGMTRTQLRAAIRWESVIIAINGTLLGLVVGTFFGWALVNAMDEEGFNTFRVPITTTVVVIVLAAVAAVAAAVLPARRAARLNILEAVAAE